MDYDLRRQGIGLALYREAALWLAEEWELRLRSGDPISCSEGVWLKLKRLGEPITKVDIPAYGSRFALDYTSLVQSQDRVQKG